MIRSVVSFWQLGKHAAGVNVGYEEFPSLEDALEAWGLVVLTHS